MTTAPRPIYRWAPQPATAADLVRPDGTVFESWETLAPQLVRSGPHPQEPAALLRWLTRLMWHPDERVPVAICTAFSQVVHHSVPIHQAGLTRLAADLARGVVWSPLWTIGPWSTTAPGPELRETWIFAERTPSVRLPETEAQMWAAWRRLYPDTPPAPAPVPSFGTHLPRVAAQIATAGPAMTATVLQHELDPIVLRYFLHAWAAADTLPSPDQLIAFADRFPQRLMYLLRLLGDHPRHQDAVTQWAFAQLMQDVPDTHEAADDPQYERPFAAAMALEEIRPDQIRRAVPDGAAQLIARLSTTVPEPDGPPYTLGWRPLRHLKTVAPAEADALMRRWRTWPLHYGITAEIAGFPGLAPAQYADLILRTPPDDRRGITGSLADPAALGETPIGRLALALAASGALRQVADPLLTDPARRWAFDDPHALVNPVLQHELLRRLPREVLAQALTSPYATDRALGFAALCALLPPETPIDAPAPAGPAPGRTPDPPRRR